MDFIMMWFIGLFLSLFIVTPILDASIIDEESAKKKYGKWSLLFKKEVNNIFLVKVNLPTAYKSLAEVLYMTMFWLLYPITIPVMIGYKIYNVCKAT